MMLPIVNNHILQSSWNFEELPTKTFKLQPGDERLIGITDKLAAMRQAIYLILNIERYEYLIYSWNYGVEFSDLFGQPATYVIPEIKRRITEALMQDTRITGVDSFQFEEHKGVISARFTVYTIFGEVDAKREVSI
ncbi:hypothetical protein FACS1894198_3840 [Clostridia bacterium]|nr:hypothetical protein FACS1894198_3840 [Clostridia bacterium]